MVDSHSQLGLRTLLLVLEAASSSTFVLHLVRSLDEQRHNARESRSELARGNAFPIWYGSFQDCSRETAYFEVSEFSFSRRVDGSRRTASRDCQ